VRRERCADPRIEQDEHGRTLLLPALTPRYFCETDRGIVGRQLDELPAYWRQVNDSLGEKGTANGPKVSISKTPPTNINLQADALLREAAAVLVSWEDRVRTAARLDPLDPDTVKFRRGHVAVDQAVKVLAGHLDTLLSLPLDRMTRAVEVRDIAHRGLPPDAKGIVHAGAGWAELTFVMGGADAGIEVLNLHYACRNFLKETKPPAVHLPVPCGRCNFTELYERRTDDNEPAGAKCRQCGQDYSEVDFSLLRAGAYAVAEVSRDALGAGRRRQLDPSASDTGSGRA
jgi:hypothetical protein